MFIIKLDDLSGDAICNLLAEHMQDMQATSPLESVHALDVNSLKHPNIKFWTVWQNNQLAGCAALKRLDQQSIELKSMRTVANFKNKGVASYLLEFLINEARVGGFQTISLETGSMQYFQPARCLYEKFGFKFCQPFSNYKEDTNSKFMTLSLVP